MVLVQKTKVKESIIDISIDSNVQSTTFKLKLSILFLNLILIILFKIRKTFIRFYPQLFKLFQILKLRCKDGSFPYPFRLKNKGKMSPLWQNQTMGNSKPQPVQAEIRWREVHSDLAKPIGQSSGLAEADASKKWLNFPGNTLQNIHNW